MKSKRIKWLDFAKGLTILSVVVLHTLPGNSWLLYFFGIFAMPLFFAISGYLYKPTNTWNKFKLMLYKKSISLVLPYIFFTIFLLLIHSVTVKNIRYLFSHLYNIYLIPIDYLWFLYCLFFIFILVGLFDLFHINFKIQLIIYLILAIVQNYFPLYVFNARNPVRGILGYIFFFYFGYLLKKFQFSRLQYLSHKAYVFLVSLVIYVVSIIISANITGLGVDTDYIHYYTFIPKLLSILVFFQIFINFNHNVLFNYFDKYGKYTLVIYLVHKPIISFHSMFNGIISNDALNSILPHVLLIAFVWYISILICYFALHFKIINFVFYPRKYINKIIIKTKWGKNLTSL